MLRPIERLFGTTPDMTPMECHSAMIAYHNRNKEPVMPLSNTNDLPTHIPYVVYDPGQREYYNVRLDLFLTEDDISFHNLKPYSEITCPLPVPLPTEYFRWNQGYPKQS